MFATIGGGHSMSRWRPGGLLRFLTVRPGLVFGILALLVFALGAALGAIRDPRVSRFLWDCVKYGAGWVAFAVPRFRRLREFWAEFRAAVLNDSVSWGITMAFTGTMPRDLVKQTYTLLANHWPGSSKVVQRSERAATVLVGGVVYQIGISGGPHPGEDHLGEEGLHMRLEAREISDDFRSAINRLDQLERFAKELYSRAGLEVASICLVKFLPHGPRAFPSPYSAKLVVSEAVGYLPSKGRDDQSASERRILRLFQNRLELYVQSFADLQQLAPLYLSL